MIRRDESRLTWLFVQANYSVSFLLQTSRPSTTLFEGSPPSKPPRSVESIPILAAGSCSCRRICYWGRGLTQGRRR